jgi:hypothetical protein
MKKLPSCFFVVEISNLVIKVRKMDLSLISVLFNVKGLSCDAYLLNSVSLILKHYY